MKDFPKNIGELKKTGYISKTIKDELRDNLLIAIQEEKSIFDGILGYDDTVIPDVQRAILSRHNILLLGLRGQAKTRIARQMVQLLDEYIPIITGSEINDDPLLPISKYAKNIIAAEGDKTPISWLHRNERYVEKLATPDVSVADLIGDVDPILAANLKLPYSDERVIHFGLIPRANRCIFVINELPDLQARIQVSLFNILQEGDIQIRGFKLRLPLDIQFTFTANPDDYTNRGSIITPLKDRIQSQILTHYPYEEHLSMAITAQEAKPAVKQKETVYIPDILKLLIEYITFEARENDLIDQKSGVSARLSITALENLYSAAELRMLKNKETSTIARISDFWGIIPSITGKVELMYEGEQEGAYNVALQLFSAAIKQLFLEFYQDPDNVPKGEKDLYSDIKNWFGKGNSLELYNSVNDAVYVKTLDKITGLKKIAAKNASQTNEIPIHMELILHGLSEVQKIQKDILDNGFNFNDMLAAMFNEDFGLNDN
jgi:magnesium chelatase subunit I